MSGSTTSAPKKIPNGLLEIAVRQVEGGKTSTKFSVFTLTCFGGSCELTALTLNQCWSDGFYPKIERASTRAGNLSVFHRTDPSTYLATWRSGRATVSLSFEYEKPAKGEVYPEHLRGFTGGYVSHGTVNGQIAAVTYKPFVSPHGGLATAKIDCPALVPSINDWNRSEWLKKKKKTQ